MSDSPNSVPGPSFRDHLTIFWVSFALLVFQIALTRVLSVVVWYHFAFLTISMVMFGVGAPGVWFALMKRPLRFLPHSLFAAGLLIPAAVVTIVKVGALLIKSSVFWVILAALPAMLALGSVLCLLLIKAEGKSIGRMYAADLVGACLGAVAVIPLLHVVPTPLLATLCAVPCFAALLAESGRWRMASVVGTVVLLGLGLGTDLLTVKHSKAYDESEVVPLVVDWSPTARITVFDETFDFLSAYGNGFSWGRGAHFPQDHSVRQYWLEQDASAGTPLTEFNGDLATVSYLLYDITTVGYQVRPARTVAIIGAGGGRDILSALLGGADDIDAVELNSHTVSLVSETFGDFSGDIYHHPGVHAFEAEGRSHLTHSNKRYDLIQISLIDSWAASAAGAFALAENSLYTVEAFRLYLDRLSDDGMISTSRWLSELPRLLTLARASLRAQGVAHPEHHMALFAAEGLGTLLLSKTPFSAEDLSAQEEVLSLRGFERLYPVSAADTLASKIIEGRTAEFAAAGLNVAPPTDDSPYFFQVISPFTDPDRVREALPGLLGSELNFGSVLILRQTLKAVVVLALLFFLLPLAIARSRPSTGALGNLSRGALYFAAIGTGFMLLENMLVQSSVLYLGHPSYAVSVVVSALLLGMGGGAVVAPRLGVSGLARSGWLAPAMVLALVYALPQIFAATLGLSLSLRVVISCLLLIPMGALLGLFFPVGMLHFGDADKPWFWAINGVFGVVAGVLSLVLSMQWGFSVVGQISVLTYLAAWLLLQGRSSGAVER